MHQVYHSTKFCLWICTECLSRNDQTFWAYSTGNFKHKCTTDSSLTHHRYRVRRWFTLPRQRHCILFVVFRWCCCFSLSNSVSAMSFTFTHAPTLVKCHIYTCCCVNEMSFTFTHAAALVKCFHIYTCCCVSEMSFTFTHAAALVKCFYVYTCCCVSEMSFTFTHAAALVKCFHIYTCCCVSEMSFTFTHAAALVTCFYIYISCCNKKGNCNTSKH
jgi:hypothetical protein